MTSATGADGGTAAPETRNGGGWRRVFLGPHGLRTGWSLLLFAAIGLAIEAAIGFVVTRFWEVPRDLPWTPGPFIAYEGAMLVIVLGITALMARIERRSLAQYGLPLRQAFRGRFWEGAGWGVASCAAVYAMMAAAGGYTVHGLAQRGAEALRWGGLWAIAMLLVGLFEEAYFRGFPLFTLSRGVGFWPGALLITLYFAGLHYFAKPNETWLDFLNVGLIGVFFCFTVRRTGDVWFAVGWHFTFNFVSMGVMGSPNTGNQGGKPITGHLLESTFHGPDWLTGGLTGAQASVFTLIMVAALFAAFHRRFRTARYPEI